LGKGYWSNQIITEHGLSISVQKTKLIAFKRREPIRSKIVITKLLKQKIPWTA
jgi:hypothetical protein